MSRKNDAAPHPDKAPEARAAHVEERRHSNRRQQAKDIGDLYKLIEAKREAIERERRETIRRGPDRRRYTPEE